MKILSLIIITMFLVIACKESTTEPNTEVINDQYLLIKNGVGFSYDLTITDSTGFSVNGNRYLLLMTAQYLTELNIKSRLILLKHLFRLIL